MKVSVEDLYRLRHTQLATQRAALRAQQADQALRELVLDMESRYGLLGTSASIDIHTGEVRTDTGNGKEPDMGTPCVDETLAGQETATPLP